MRHEDARHADALEAWYTAHRDEALEALIRIEVLAEEFERDFDTEIDDVSDWLDVFRIDRNELKNGGNP